MADETTPDRGIRKSQTVEPSGMKKQISMEALYAQLLDSQQAQIEMKKELLAIMAEQQKAIEKLQAEVDGVRTQYDAVPHVPAVLTKIRAEPEVHAATRTAKFDESVAATSTTKTAAHTEHHEHHLADNVTDLAGNVAAVFDGDVELKIELEEEPAQEVTLEESMWGIALLIGTQPVGAAASCLLSFLLVLNVMMQMLFIILLKTTDLTAPEYTADDVKDYRTWRRNEAHTVLYYDQLSDKSLASRVCGGVAALSVARSIGDDFDDVDQYLDHFKGTMMLGLSLIAWYCTVAQEINATINSYLVTISVPIGTSTEILSVEGGRYRVLQLSLQRLVVRVCISLIRLGIAFWMFLQGTQFLVYTISISDLLLNAVALEFVISMDELLFVSLAPARPKRILANMAGFTLKPAKTWQGMDFRTMVTFLTVCGCLGFTANKFITDQLTILYDVKAAICAGDQDFVYTLDGVGSISWGFPESANRDPPSDWPYAEWQTKEYDDNLPFQSHVLEAVLNGKGREVCPADECYDATSAVPVPKPDQAECCLPHQTRVPAISGGKFAIITKSRESLYDANLIWNPGCSDTINSVAYYINLLQGSMASAINAVTGNLDPCNGYCTSGKICKLFNATLYAQNPDAPNPQNGYDCINPVCDDVAPYCGSSSVVGVRARQICPETCGCDQPRSPLALFLPESGCPAKCLASTTYRVALAEMPCEDVARNDTNFVGFLDQWAVDSRTWPKDWNQSGLVFIDLFRRFGCQYLTLNGIPEDYDWPAGALFWPANFGVGVSPCMENGYYYPVKPISYFCPVSCGCRSGDKHCPDSCPARHIPANALGQPAYNGLDPNPSPANVPGFPWRYSFLRVASNCTGIDHCALPDH